MLRPYFAAVLISLDLLNRCLLMNFWGKTTEQKAVFVRDVKKSAKGPMAGREGKG